jgi:hypothetical protein
MMYKIGNQFILLHEVFAISDMSYYDGCTINIYIHSNNGAKVEVKFKAIKSDNCSVGGGVPESFIERTKKEIDLFISEVEKINKK